MFSSDGCTFDHFHGTGKLRPYKNHRRRVNVKKKLVGTNFELIFFFKLIWMNKTVDPEIQNNNSTSNKSYSQEQTANPKRIIRLIHHVITMLTPMSLYRVKCQQ